MFPKNVFRNIWPPPLGAGVLCISASGLLVELHIVFNRICCFFCGIIVSGVLWYLEICKSVQVFQSFQNTHPFAKCFYAKNIVSPFSGTLMKACRIWLRHCCLQFVGLPVNHLGCGNKPCVHHSWPWKYLQVSVLWHWKFLWAWQSWTASGHGR